MLLEEPIIGITFDAFAQDAFFFCEMDVRQEKMESAILQPLLRGKPILQLHRPLRGFARARLTAAAKEGPGEIDVGKGKCRVRRDGAVECRLGFVEMKAT